MQETSKSSIRNITKILIVMMLLAPLVGLLALRDGVVVASPAADWWDTGWLYRRQIIITNENSTAGIDNFSENILINISGWSNKPLENLDDLRFRAENGDEIPHFVENYNADENFKVWVRYPWPIAASGSDNIYMYYGNASAASTEDGDDTFAFFDHFGGAILDADKWDDTGNPPVSDSSVNLNTKGDYIQTDLSYSLDGYRIHARLYTGVFTDYMCFLGFGQYDSGGLWQFASTDAGYITFLTTGYRVTINDSVTSDTITPYPANEWKVWETYITGMGTDNAKIHGIEDDNEFGTLDNTAALSSTRKIFFGRHGNAAGAVDFKADYIFLRKFTTPAPSFTIGEEELSIPPGTRIGYETKGQTDTYKSIDEVLGGSKFQAPVDGELISITTYLTQRLAYTPNIKYAIYADNSGYPGVLVGYTENWTITGGWDGWKMLDIDELYENIVGDNYYWLIAWGSGKAYTYYDTGDADQGVFMTLDYVVSFPENFPLEGDMDTNKYSIYGTYMSPPGQATLVSPTDNSKITDNTPTFSWTDGINADNHTILVDDNENCLSPIDNNAVIMPTVTWTKTGNGYEDGTYYWKVMAVNDMGENTSSTWTFEVVTEAASLTTENATNITDTTATLNAQITYGDFDNVNVQFELRATMFDNYTIPISPATTGNWLDRTPVNYVAPSDYTGGEFANYTCDGTDDAAEINAAIENVAVSGGGKVVLLSGTYYSTTWIVIDTSNITLVGENLENIKFTYSGTQIAMLRIPNTASDIENILVENLRFTNDGGYQEATEISGVQIICGNKIVIRNVIVENVPAIGIYGEFFSVKARLTNLWIENCRVENTADSGITVSRHYSLAGKLFENIYILNNTVTRTGTDDNPKYYWIAHSLTVWGPSHCVIANNTVFEAYGPGIVVTADGNLNRKVENILVQGNTVFNSGFGLEGMSGIYLSGVDSIDRISDVVIKGNNIFDNLSDNQIYGVDSSPSWVDNITIIHNTFDVITPIRYYGTGYVIDNNIGGWDNTKWTNTTLENYSENVSGLYPNENYEYRAIIEFDDETDNGEIITFETPLWLTQPTLLTPENISTFYDNTPTFTWENGRGADNHWFVLDDDSDFSSTKENRVVQTETYTIPAENYLPDGTYWWKIVAENATHENEAEAWTFTQDGVDEPTLQSPDNDTSTYDTTPTFTWTKATYADIHNLQVDTEDTFSSPINENVILGADNESYTLISELSADNYYWRVVAIQADGDENSSETWSLEILSKPSWWDNNWLYRKEITLGDHPENYQIKIFLDMTDNLSDHAQADFDDLRFLENNNAGVLQYHRENWNYDENVTVWFRREENEISDSSVWLYYGNVGASTTENGDNTFIFFDTFDGAAVNEAVWTITDGSPSVANSILTLDYDGDQDMYTTENYNLPLIFRGYGIIEAANYGWFGMGAGDGWNPYISYWYEGYHKTRTKNNGTSEDNASQKVAGVWYTYETRLGLSTQNYYLDDVIDIRVTQDFSGVSDTKIAIDARDGGGRVDADWVLLRKWAAVEPTVILGDEEESVEGLPSQPVLYLPADDSTTYDNTPYFEWENSANADNHRLLVDDDSGFGSPNENYLTTDDNSYTIEDGNSLANKLYYWKVIAQNENGNRTSSTWSFTVSGIFPAQSTLYLPENGALQPYTDNTPYFEWTQGENTTSYNLVVDNDSDFTSIEENQTLVTDNFYTIAMENSLVDEIYYYKVIGINENGETPSAVWTFRLKTQTDLEYSPAEELWSYHDTNSEHYETGISADGHYIVAGTDSGEVRLFSENDNTPLWTATPGGYVACIALSDNGQYIAVGTSTAIILYSKDSSTPLWSTGATLAMGVSISDNGDFIAAGTAGDKLHLFNRASSTPIWTYTFNDRVREAKISGDGKYVIGVSEDGYARLFGDVNNTPIWSFDTGNVIRAADISDNGDYVVVGGWDNILYLFGNTDNTPIWTYEYTDNTYVIDLNHNWYTVAVSDNGQYIAAAIGNQEGEYFMFTKDDNVPIWSYNVYGQEVFDTMISDDGSRMVGSGWGGSADYFSNIDNVPLWVYPLPWKPNSVDISGDGTRIVCTEGYHIHFIQSGFFPHELKTENQINPLRVITTTPEFSFKIPNKIIDNAVGFHIQVGTSAGDNTSWDDNTQTITTDNVVYVTYAGSSLSSDIAYYWRVKLKDNESNWGMWSINKSFKIVALDDFSNYREISFTENIPDNYQVRVEIDNATNMDANFIDLLFYDSDYPSVGLAYYIENLVAGSAANVWVKVHDNEDIRMYYGNAGIENASSGDDTFPDLFDNFDGTSKDDEIWTQSKFPSVSGGVMTVNTDVVWSKESFGTDLALRANVDITNTSGNTYVGFAKHLPNSDLTPWALIWNKSDNLYLRTGFASSSTRTTVSSATDYFDTYTVYDIKRFGTDNVEVWANDDNLVLSSTTNIPSARMPIFLEALISARTIKIDWIFLHKIIAVEPIVTIGSENEEAINVSPVIENIYITDIDNTTIDNTSPNSQVRFWVEVQDNDDLSDIENVVLKVYLDDIDLEDNKRTHYTFMFVNTTGIWSSSPEGYIVADNCIAGDNSKTEDNYIFTVKFNSVAYPTSTDNWDTWAKAEDSDDQDNETFENEFDVDEYVSFTKDDTTISFTGRNTENVEASESPTVLTINANCTFNVQVKLLNENWVGETYGDNIGVDNTMFDNNNDLTDGYITLSTSYQNIYSNIGWGENIEENIYSFMNIPNIRADTYVETIYVKVVSV